jgi:tetratricopeptide (TPR) repeat protein
MVTGAVVLSAQQNNVRIRTDPEDCLTRLTDAESAYQNGQFNNCIDVLERALNLCIYSRSDKLRALEILAKSYVETGEMDKADATVNLLLKNFPHYESNDPENPELYNRLVKKYAIHPRFTIGAKNTANWLRRPTTKVYSVLDGIDYSQPLVESSYWFTYYGVAEYEFDHGISLSIDGMTFVSTYNRIFTKGPSFSLSYWERATYVEFPMYIKKYFHPAKNFLAYISCGIGPFINYSAKGNVTLSYKVADVVTGKNADFDGGMYNFDVLPIKHKLNWQWNAGIGIGYTIKNLRFFIDTRYLGLMGSITAPENSDRIPELKNDYFYIENEMKLNQFEVGATISYTLFNSVKRIRK